MNQYLEYVDEDYGAMNRLQENRIRKFVAALESGKYPQIRRRLKTDEGYCAEGVLCDVYRKSYRQAKAKWQRDEDGGYRLVSKIGNTSATWASTTILSYFFGQWRSKLIVWNDQENLSFPQIAQRLKEQFNLC